MPRFTKSVEVFLHPNDLAVMFADMDSTDQAQFFAKVWRISLAWPGAGWCQQSCDIIRNLDKDGRDTVRALAEHLALDEAPTPELDAIIEELKA